MIILTFFGLRMGHWCRIIHNGEVKQKRVDCINALVHAPITWWI